MDAPDSPIASAPRRPLNTRTSAAVRFPLVCLISFGLSALAHTLTSSVSGLELATAARRADEPWQVGAFLVWKLVQLGIAWFAGYDYQDLAALTLLTNAPFYYLIHSFWAVELLPVLAALTIDVTALALPFALLRPLHAHTAKPIKTANQAVARDWQIDLLTAILAAAISAVTFYLSYFADFGVFLVSHFDDIRTLAGIHDASLLQLTVGFAANGVAAMLFLFRPSMAAVSRPTLTEPKSPARRTKKFHPETATLSETIAHNLGYGSNGLSHRAEVLAKRTLVLVGCTLTNTFVRVFGAVEGTDVVGSFGYAGLWAFSNVAVAVAYAWLGQEY